MAEQDDLNLDEGTETVSYGGVDDLDQVLQDEFRQESDNLLGEDTPTDFNTFGLIATQEDVLDDNAEEIKALGGDVDELKQNLPAIPENEEISPGQQVYPLPKIPDDTSREEDVESAIEDFESALNENIEAYRTQLKNNKPDLSASDIQDLAHRREMQLRAGNFFVPPDTMPEDLNDVAFMSRLPTRYTAKIAYEAEKLAMAEEDGIIDFFKGTFLQTQNAQNLQNVFDLVDQGILEFDTEFIKEVEALTKKGKTKFDAQKEAQKNFIEGQKPYYKEKVSEEEQKNRDELSLLGTDDAQLFFSNSVGLYAGFKAAKSTLPAIAATPTPVGKAIAALVLGGGSFAGAYGLGFLASDTAFNLRASPEDLSVDVPILKTGKTVHGAYELTKSMSDAIPGLPNVIAYLEILPEASRAYLMTSLVDAAVKLGLSDAIAAKPSFQKFVQSAAQDPALSEKNLKDIYYKIVRPEMQGPIQMMRVLNHPDVRKDIETGLKKSGIIAEDSELFDYIQGAGNFVLDMFGVDPIVLKPDESVELKASLIQDIMLEIAGTDDYRRAQQLDRLQEYNRIKTEIDDELKLKILDYDDDVFYKEFRKFRDNPEKYTEFDEKVFVNRFINTRSWDTANESWRGEQPNVERFKTFVRTHYAGGGIDPDSEKFPMRYALFQAVKNQESDEKIQELLNKARFGLVSSFNFSNRDPVWKRPSFESMKKFGLGVLEYKEEERGQKTSAFIQQKMFKRMFTDSDEKGLSYMFEPSYLYKLYSIFNIADAAIDEIPIVTPKFLTPVMSKLGFPRGVWGTSAGLDYALGTGIREGMDDYLARVRSRGKMLIGGGMMGSEEVLLAAGYKRNDPEMMFTLINTGGDFLPKESFLLGAVSKPLRFASNASRFSKNKMFKELDGKAAGSLKIIEILDGIRKDPPGDRVIEYHKLLEQAFREEIAAGRNPLRFLSRAEQDLFEDILTSAARNPDHAKAAVQKATTSAKNIRKISKKAMREIGSNDYTILRSSASYIRLEQDLDNLVNAGVIEPKYKNNILSMIEHQAIITASEVGSRFNSAAQVLANTRITYKRPSGIISGKFAPTIRIVDLDKKSITGKPGVPKGYFEFDDRTGRSILNFFEAGDINTVWKMEGLFMSHIMGEKFKNKVFRFFDHEVNQQGQISLTNKGQQQFTDAWMTYRNTANNTNGYVRRLFDQLWLGIHSFWNKLRRKPNILPAELKAYWDLEFGVLPTDARQVRTAASGASFKRSKQHFYPADEGFDESLIRRSREAMVKDLGYDENVIRSLLGDRKTQVTRTLTDAEGQPRRVVEQRYLPRQYDALDTAVKILALIKTANFRKRLGKRKYVSIGTEKYHVSENRLNEINARVSEKITRAFGKKWMDTRKKLIQSKRDGTSPLSDPSTYPEGVNQSDVSAFLDRISITYQSDDPIKISQGQNFFVLNNREQAGLKTLLQEIGNQPEADILSIQLLDPQANLRILSVSEYNDLINVLKDIEATPLNRRSRNTVSVGFRDRVQKTLNSRKVLQKVGQLFTIMGKFGRRPDLNPGSFDPVIVDIMEGGARKKVGAGEALLELSKTKDFSKVDTVGEFFKQTVDRSVSRIKLEYLNTLKILVDELDGLFERLESESSIKAQEAEALQKQAARNLPGILYDPAMESVTVAKVIASLHTIQEILDGFFGMTARERESIHILRITDQKLKDGQKLRDFSPEDRAVIADAISVLHVGLKVKDDYVTRIGEGLLKRALVYKEIPSSVYNPNVGRRAVLYKTYKSYFEGTDESIKYLFEQPDIISAVLRTKGVPDARYTSLLGFQINPSEQSIIGKIYKFFGRELGAELPEDNIKMISMLTLMKMDEIDYEMSLELARYGYDMSTREIIGKVDFNKNISVSRARYLDRVASYIDSVMSYSDMTKLPLDANGKVITKDIKPKARPQSDLYGPTEQKGVSFKTRKAFTDLDLQAQHDAGQILARSGMRREQGSPVRVNIGDKEYLLPPTMMTFFEEHTLKAFPDVQFRLEWGKGGTGEYFLKGKVEDATIRQLQTLAAATGKAASIIFSPTAFYAGLLIGTGGLPMIGYGVGVFIGGLSQLHLGQGMAAVVKDTLQGPLVLGETLAGTTLRGVAETDFRVPETLQRAGLPEFVGLPENVRGMVRGLADSLQSRTSFTAGVLARMHGKDYAVPETAPLLLSDGRVFTADDISNSVKRYGWRSAMVDAFQDARTVMQFYDRFSKANPIYMTTAISTLTGIGLGSPVASAAFGFTLGYILKPGNIFSRSHRFYREAFSAIDSYLRVKVLIRELERGTTLSEASETVREIALDYSNLSDAEKSYFARYFAFYTYYSQSMNLYLKSVYKNPQRVINQLKFIQKTQQKAYEDAQATELVSDWDKFRAVIPFKINGQVYRMPFLIAGDDTLLLTEILGMIPILNPLETAGQNFRNIIGRTSPLVPIALKSFYNVDTMRGTPLSRSSFQVPSHVVKLDRLFTGGALYDALDIEFIDADKLNLMPQADRKKKRISMARIEHPGRGIYIAKNRPLYLYLFDYLQTPFTGRMGDNITALARSNILPAELKLNELQEQMHDITDGEPLLSNVGVLLGLGLVKEVDPGKMDLSTGQVFVDNMNPDIAPDGQRSILAMNRQLTTGSLDLLLSQGKAFEKDGKTYVFTDQFYPAELGRVAGFSRSPQREKDSVMARKIRSRISRIKEITKDIESTDDN